MRVFALADENVRLCWKMPGPVLSEGQANSLM